MQFAARLAAVSQSGIPAVGTKAAAAVGTTAGTRVGTTAGTRVGNSRGPCNSRGRKMAGAAPAVASHRREHLRVPAALTERGTEFSFLKIYRTDGDQMSPSVIFSGIVNRYEDYS